MTWEDDGTRHEAHHVLPTEDEGQGEGMRHGAEDGLGSSAGAIDSDESALLHRQLEEASRKAEEHWALYLRTRADAENTVRRAEREADNARRFALERFIQDLLPVKDSLELGAQATQQAEQTMTPEEWQRLGPLLEGPALTLRLLTGVLERHGVREIDPCGEPFDPSRHEAVAMESQPGLSAHQVVRVMQKGYALHDRLLRPAMVVVASPTASGDDTSPGE
jgi:molecular chaperone GrpE